LRLYGSAQLHFKHRREQDVSIVSRDRSGKLRTDVDRYREDLALVSQFVQDASDPIDSNSSIRQAALDIFS
jgi:hypothetical protein